jgi:hypothetical protein
MTIAVKRRERERERETLRVREREIEGCWVVDGLVGKQEEVKLAGTIDRHNGGCAQTYTYITH